MEELLGARVPQNPRAEQSVIGSMLIDPDCIPEVLKLTRAPFFYTRANREIFETLQTMFNYGQTIDPVTLEGRMRERGVYHEETSHAYIAELLRVTPTAANVEDYIRILADMALQRELARVGGEITAMVNGGLGTADDMLELAERSIFELRRDRGQSGLRPLSEVVQTVYNNLAELKQSGAKLPGLSTGFVDLDERILGMSPGELVLIASRPGMGKTSIAMNIAAHVAKTSGGTVAIFSLEMSREQLVNRMMSRETAIDGQRLQTGRISDAEFRQVVAAAGTLSALKILIDDNPMLSVADMNAECRRIGEGLALVVVDYLQLMQSADNKQNRGENRQQIVSDISRMMKIMAKDLRVPVLCLSQLNRAAEGRQDKRPTLSDLRESGAIEQDADIVIGLYREGYYNKECEDPTAAELVVLKNRKGQIGSIPVRWLANCTSYVSMERRHEE